MIRKETIFFKMFFCLQLNKVTNYTLTQILFNNYGNSIAEKINSENTENMY